jgi:hypothetical protein
LKFLKFDLDIFENFNFMHRFRRVTETNKNLDMVVNHHFLAR